MHSIHNTLTVRHYLGCRIDIPYGNLAIQFEVFEKIFYICKYNFCLCNYSLNMYIVSYYVNLNQSIQVCTAENKFSGTSKLLYYCTKTVLSNI